MLSRLGRFDAVRLLLGAGADKSQLGWTTLHEAVALGSLEDMRAVLSQGADLEARDWWERTPFPARERFAESCGEVAGPVWCADRFGQSLTLLPDGRAVQIGGEHEDYYDPDFCIYNDVFLFSPDRSVAIFGYPEKMFPPTDFHTATLAGGFIYAIGSLGYQGTRRFGETPVYRLDLDTFRMERVEAGGDVPGWIYRHRAEAVPDGIRVWGGTIAEPGKAGDGGGAHRTNAESFMLDLDRLLWRREPG